MVPAHLGVSIIRYSSSFLQVCRLTRLMETSSSSSSAQLSIRLASLRSTLATKLPPRVLLPTISRCYNTMVVDKKVRVELQVCLLFSTEAGKVQSLYVRLGLKFSRMI